MLLTLLVVVGLIVIFVFFFRFFSGEKERIKTLFRLYKISKVQFPERSDRELLEIVVEEHIPPGKSIRLKDTGMTGKQYIDGVFEAKPLGIDELICHIIRLEFPKKYQPHKVNYEDLWERTKSGKLTPHDELETMVRGCHQECLG